MANILVVEDEKDLLDIYQEVLEDAGYKVETAENGKVALEKLSASPFDLVLLDLMMPEVDGMEVLKVIRADKDGKYKKLKVIVLTNLSSDVVIKESFDARADGYLMKTELTPSQVVEEVSGFLK